MSETQPIDRVIRFRLLPETRARANMLAQLAGANRFVWNAALARNETLFRARNEAMKAAGWDGEPETRKEFSERFEQDALRDAGWDGDPETRKHFYKLVDRAKFPKPDYNRNGLANWFSAFRPSVADEQGRAWLKDLPSHSVRATLRDMSDAYKSAFDGTRGFPKFKSRNKRGRRVDGFWIDDPSLENGMILIPRAHTPKDEPARPKVRMKIRRRGKSPYDGFRVKRARIVLDGKKWFVFLWYEIPKGAKRPDGAPVCEPPKRKRETIGIDRNTVKHGAALSAPIKLPDGEVVSKTAIPQRILMLEQRRRRYQRMMSRKADAALRAVGWKGEGKNRRAYEGILKKKHREEKALQRENGTRPSRRIVRFGESQYSVRYAIAAERAAKTAAKIRRIRENWAHQAARSVARTAGIVGLEDLPTQAMTKSAKGDIENPGKGVRQKAGLNAAILAAGWGALKRALEYKCGEVVTIPPRDTSRRCNECGKINESLTLDTRAWTCAKCGTTHDRDINAAMNIAKIACAEAETSGAILARGHGASARGGRPPPRNRRSNPAGKRREVRPPPSILDGPERAKREQ